MYNLKYLELEINNHIASGNLDASLNIIIKFVENIVKDSRATASVFGSSTLDKLCQRIGSEALKLQKEIIRDNLVKDCQQKTVYIATELYNSGGHTAVIEDFIMAEPQKKHLIIITDTLQTAQREVIENRFARLPVKIDWAPNSSALDKLIWLQSQLLEKQPTQIFLFNHGQDAVAVAAVQPSLTPQLIFYHHFDHQLCLGLYIKYAQHIDPHAFGFYNCRNNLGIVNTTYIPLTVDDLGTPSAELDFLADGMLRTCSSGSSLKFEQSYQYSYMEEVPKIIDVTKGVHIHIGGLSAYALSEIRQGLNERLIPPERFVYIPWVKSLWKTMHEQRVDVYINSFPLGGGRACVEVMGSGTPIIGHQNYHSRLLSGVDVIYPEAFFWQNPEELYSYLKNLTREVLSEQAAYARKHYEIYHKPSILKQCLEKFNLQEDGLYPPPLREYVTDDLQTFLEKSTSLDLSRQFIEIVDAIDPILDENKYYVDKSKISNFLYRLTISKTELERSSIQRQHAQAKLERSRVQLQQTQDELGQARLQLQQTQAELVQTRSQLQQMQAELVQANSQLQQMQAELVQVDSQLQQAQAELVQVDSQLQQAQVELAQIRLQLQQTQAELSQAHSQLQHTQADLEYFQFLQNQHQVEWQQLQDKITAMESSKFWNLRRAWFKLKKTLGLKTDE